MNTYSVTFEVTIGVHGLVALAIIAITIVAIVALTSRRESRRAVHTATVAAHDAAPARRSHDEQTRPRRLPRTVRRVSGVANGVLIGGLGGLLTNLVTWGLQLGVALFTGG